MKKKLYCHTNGFLGDTDTKFAIKGKVYDIHYEGKNTFEVIDEENSLHSFTKDKFQKWFDLIEEGGKTEEEDISNRVFLYVYGEDYSAMHFSKNYNEQTFYEDMVSKGLRKTTIDTDETYAEVEILEFEQVDSRFIEFIRAEIMDYDGSKHKDFFEVNPV